MLDRTTIDTLIVPGAFLVEDVTKDTELTKWVAARAPKCRRVCSTCVDSFFLAPAGIMDGRRAATHWMHTPLLAKQHPDVKVEPDAIFVRDGHVWSSAGVTTGIDLALALSYLVDGLVKSGALVKLLQGYEPSPQPVTLIHLSQRQVPLKLRAFWTSWFHG